MRRPSPIRNMSFVSLSIGAMAILSLAGSHSQADRPPESKQQKSAAMLKLTLRHRVETSKNSGRYHEATESVRWDPKSTAMIVCDMWDSHHCLNAVRRVKQIAPLMNRILEKSRAQGVLIIHAPSSCMGPYENHPARRRAQAAPRAANLPVDIGNWCSRIPAEERGAYPVDQSDGGEDDDPQEHKKWRAELTAMGRNPNSPWKSQIDVIKIHSADAISDSGVEIWNLLEQGKIENVILMGVHTNMCVLGRPFGLRQMARNGKNVVLVRDMTDTMYNPASWPYVSHFSGTDLIINHIEKFICATITSDQFLGGKPFRFAKDRRPHIVIVMAEDEYQTNQSLPQFAENQLHKNFRVTLVHGSEKDRNDIPGLEALREADLAIFSIRRRTLPKPQLDMVREYLDAGKPLLAIRTTSHAFSLFGNKPPAPGQAAWPSFDAEVLGGNYHGHHGGKRKKNPKTLVRFAPHAAGHPILNHLPADELGFASWLYKVSPLGKSAVPLLIGRTLGKAPHQPVAWTHSYQGGRIFYTSLGHPDDFKIPAFRQLLSNAIYWTLHAEESAPKVAAAMTAKDYATTWNPVNVPGTWGQQSGGKLRDYDGYGWYRCFVEVPKAWQGQDLRLELGRIDDCDETFFNGQPVGSSGTVKPKYESATDRVRTYQIPAKLLRPGTYNMIAIRVYDGGGQGGFKSPGQRLSAGGRSIGLSGTWQLRIGDDPAWAQWSPETSQYKLGGATFSAP